MLLSSCKLEGCLFLKKEKDYYPQVIFSQLENNDTICLIIDIVKFIVDNILVVVTWCLNSSILIKILTLFNLNFVLIIKIATRCGIYFEVTKIKKMEKVHLAKKKLISYASWIIIILFLMTIGFTLLLFGLAIKSNVNDFILILNFLVVSFLGFSDMITLFFLKRANVDD